MLEKINKTNKTLVRVNRGHRGSIQINKIINEKGNIIPEAKEIQKNHHILLQKPILNKTGWNEQFSRHMSGAKVKSGSDK